MYVAIEGPIGAGKTSLAQRLSRSLDARLLLEKPEANPFLPRFYRDPARVALPTQLTFLMQRAGQAEELQQGDLFSHNWVADFTFDKDRLFAELTLSRVDFELYSRVFERLAMDVPAPDCIIHLQAPLSTLLQRIEKRGRGYEAGIDPEYLARLADAYGRWFITARAARLIEVDTGSLDLLGDDAHYQLLLDALAGDAPRQRLPAMSLV
ncbi:MAG: deoxynucleoside kinase [Hydrocarboniphaga sp.]|uniref:deoxynucleoside kinase n=1 Tax=Hydrocarboniphaga sp. TaxID=2033016 RepID=UPI00261E3C45|nr:deoxynucleoside kinase [Hydrocarboniphaga sp.]MDB5968902.1 deoxynucleoside kinase [Hydrocarboniphaga sp.]